MAKAYYNEFDPKAAAWLRELIAQGHIAPGDVDERSISDVRPDELSGYTQCHFFAGIGVWSYALRNAGWPDDRPVWTGSCPCQPFSTAGQRKGTADERHLWPHWFWLIAQCRPVEVFGEQVASKDGRTWIDTVQTDMEALGFAFGAADLCAAGVGAPHIRQRLFFYGDVADASNTRPQGRERVAASGGDGSERDSAVGGVGNAGRQPGQRHPGGLSGAETPGTGTGYSNGRHGHRHSNAIQTCRPAPTNGFWAGADWLLCRDEPTPKLRPVEPRTFPLADGAPARVGRLRGYGNAIVAPVAQTFIEATQGW